MRWRVRLATPGDVATVASIHVRAWRAAYPGMVPGEVLDRLEVDRSAERWMRVLAADSADGPRVFLAVDGSRSGRSAGSARCAGPSATRTRGFRPAS